MYICIYKDWYARSRFCDFYDERERPQLGHMYLNMLHDAMNDIKFETRN